MLLYLAIDITFKMGYAQLHMYIYLYISIVYET